LEGLQLCIPFKILERLISARFEPIIAGTGGLSTREIDDGRYRGYLDKKAEAVFAVLTAVFNTV